MASYDGPEKDMLLIILSLPFLQLGFTYWLSVQTAMAIMLLVKLRTQLLAAIQRNFIVKLIVALCMFLPLVLDRSSDYTHDFLQFGREALLFIVLVSIVRQVRGRILVTDIRKTTVLVLIVTAGLALLILLQFTLNKFGIFIGLPKTYFANNGDTATTLDDVRFALTYHGVIRPAGTFGEPSYCAFVLVSIVLMYFRYLYGPDRYLRKMSTLIITLAILSGLILQSLLFVVSIVLLFAVSYLRYFEFRRVLLPSLVLGGIAFIAVAFGWTSAVSERVDAIATNQSDSSTVGRVIAPALVTIPFLFDHPFGVPHSVQEDVMTPYAAEFGLQGGEILADVFSLFFTFGIIAVPLLWLLLGSASDATFKLYILLAISQDGVIFGIDKVGIICLTALMYEASKKLSPRTYPETKAVKLVHARAV